MPLSRYAALVLLIRTDLGIGLVHAPHDWIVCVFCEHGVAFVDLTGGFVGPGIPQACEAPRFTIESLEAPPDVLAAFPIRFVEPIRGDDAALATQPGVFVAGFLDQLLRPSAVGGVLDVVVLAGTNCASKSATALSVLKAGE